MRELLKKLDWWFDINVAYYFYNGNKMHRYHQYLESKWGIKPATIRENIAELNPDAIMWDGLDAAIIGISDDNRVVYLIPKMITELQMANDWTYEEADEWLSFNITSAYVGEFTPIHIYEF